MNSSETLKWAVLIYLSVFEICIATGFTYEKDSSFDTVNATEEKSIKKR